MTYKALECLLPVILISNLVECNTCRCLVFFKIGVIRCPTSTTRNLTTDSSCCGSNMSASTKWRQKVKEENPERYAEYLKKEKERSKKRRIERKLNWDNEQHHTRSAIQKHERDQQLSRDRQKRFYDKKKRSHSRRSTLRIQLPSSPQDTHQKRPKDMTPDEYKAHKCLLRAKSREAQSSQKTRRVREKNTKSRRQQRLKKKLSAYQETPQQTGGPSEQTKINKLKKSEHNFVSSVRQDMIRRSRTPAKFARMVWNLSANTHSPRKKHALHLAGVNVGSCRKTLFTQKTKPAKKTAKRTRKQRKDCINKHRVHMFFVREDISRALPHKRYARKEGPGYVMQQTLKCAHGIFIADNPDMNMSYSKFTQLRPKTVRKISSVFAETCQCVYCLNVRLKVHAINRAVGTSALDEQIKSNLKIQGEVRFVDTLLCSKNGNKFAKRDCIVRDCNNCNDIKNTLEKYYAPLATLNPSVTWTSWRRKKLEKKTIREPIVRQAPFTDLLEELIEDILHPAQNTTFIKHLFVAHWQYHQYRYLKENLKRNQVVMVMDFAENKKSQSQDEVKSAYFDKKQMTLHPVVAFYRHETGELIRHAINLISDDVNHDHNAVHHFTKQAMNYMEKKGILLPGGEVFIFSDGCAAQYKGKGTFADLTHYPVPVQRIYFGSEHGKGEADAETGTINKGLDTAVLCRKVVIRDAADFFSWAELNMTKDEPLSKRTFLFVPENDIMRERPETNVQGIKGSRAFHQMVKVSPFVLKARSLACFCEGCQQRNGDCINRQYVDLFKIYKLQQNECPDLSPPSSPVHYAAPSPPAQPAAVSASSLSHSQFFTQCQQNLLQAISFDALVQCSIEDKSQADQFFSLKIPEEEPQFSRQNTDHTAENQCPPEAKQAQRFSLQTVADGNCFPRALSAALFGEDIFHLELRVRLTWELATNKARYLSPLSVSRGTDLDGCETLSFYHTTGDFPDDSIFTAFKKEVMQTAQNSKSLGPWHLLAAANILEKKIISIYPHRGSAASRAEMNRLFCPDTEKGFPIYILWMSNRTDMDNISPDFWTANHVVPLVLASLGPAKEPKVGDFVRIVYSINKKRCTWIALVIPAPEGVQLAEGEFELKFMREQKRGYYVFPTSDDLSVMSLREAEELDILDPPIINNRGHHLFSL